MNYLKLRPFFFLWLGFISLVTLGSLMPITHVPETSGMISDKIQHAFAYALLGVLALKSAKTIRVKFLLLSLTCAVGVLIEYVQPLTGRYFELNDIVANSVGLFIGFVLVWLVGMLSSRVQLKNTK